MAQYRCPHCEKIIERDSDKRWIKSWCEDTGTDARIQLYAPIDLDKDRQEVK